MLGRPLTGATIVVERESKDEKSVSPVEPPIKFKEDTPALLRMYFGLDHIRSVKKKYIADELVLRGVSSYSVIEAIERMLFAIGWAADNRIEEIDAQMDEDDG